MTEYRDNDGITNVCDDLLPCPFCGGIPQWHYRGNKYYKKTLFIIECHNCHVEMRQATLNFRNPLTENVTRYVINKWNHREEQSK